MKWIIMLWLGIALPAFAERPVIINGKPLTAEAVAGLEARYAIETIPGRYWCDPISGLWGIEGQPSAGFMSPTSCTGTLSTNASYGDSEVYVNGRELPIAEAWYWARLLGSPSPLPGHYALSGSGTFSGTHPATGQSFSVNLWRHGTSGNSRIHRSDLTGIGSGSAGGCHYVIGSDFSYSGPGC